MINRLGIVSIVVAAVVIGAAIPLHCFQLALEVGVFSLLNGAAFGGSLAAVTRTKITAWIYLFLLCAGSSLMPLFLQWPPAYSEDVRLWPATPDIWANYFDVARVGLFLVGIAWPFARFGQHSADTQAGVAS